MKNRRLVWFLLLGVLLLGAALVWFALKSASPKEIVRIQGLSNCSENINKSVAKNIEKALYGRVRYANTYNKLPTQPFYDASIRNKTCELVANNNAPTSTGEKQLVKTTSAIVDIPDARQSWKVTYDWVTKSQEILTDLGELQTECVLDSQRIYEDFNCEKIISKLRYGTDNYDPILQYMPYSGLGFDLKYDDKTKKVTALIYIPEREKNNQELIQNDKAIVPDWFTERNLDINKYVVEYVIEYQ